MTGLIVNTYIPPKCNLGCPNPSWHVALISLFLHSLVLTSPWLYRLQVLFPDLNLLNRSSGKARVDVQCHSCDKSTLMTHPNLDQGHHCHCWGYDKLIHFCALVDTKRKSKFARLHGVGLISNCANSPGLWRSVNQEWGKMVSRQYVLSRRTQQKGWQDSHLSHSKATLLLSGRQQNLNSGMPRLSWSSHNTINLSVFVCKKQIANQ